jgi:hypothetical protein
MELTLASDKHVRRSSIVGEFTLADHVPYIRWWPFPLYNLRSSSANTKTLRHRLSRGRVCSKARLFPEAALGALARLNRRAGNPAPQQRLHGIHARYARLRLDTMHHRQRKAMFESNRNNADLA